MQGLGFGIVVLGLAGWATYHYVHKKQRAAAYQTNAASANTGAVASPAQPAQPTGPPPTLQQFLGEDV